MLAMKSACPSVQCGSCAILNVGGAALTPDPDTGGASPSTEILEIGSYSGLTLAGEWNSLLSVPGHFSLLSIIGIHLDQLRKRTPEEYFKCEFIYSFIQQVYQGNIKEEASSHTQKGRVGRVFVKKGRCLGGESYDNGSRG